MHLRDEVLELCGVDIIFEVLGELALVLLGLLLLKVLRILSNVAAKQVALVELSVELLLLREISSEALLIMGDVKAAVASALQRTEYACAGRGAREADIEVGAKRPGAFLSGLDVVVFAINFGLALVRLVKAELAEEAAGEEEAGAVGGGVVLVADGEAVVS